MFIDKSMHKKVITITKDMTILEARELMRENQIRHLPVIEPDNTLVGIITDRDIRSASPSIVLQEGNDPETEEKFSSIKVKDVMTISPITVSPMHTLQDALLLIHKTNVGAFPVVDEKGILKGIISVRDLLRSFINVMGIGEPGILLCILAEEKVGQLKKIVDAITEEGISFGSILVAQHWEEDKRAVFPYILTNRSGQIKKKLKNLGFTLLDPMDWYMDRLPKND
ncbi:CBS domain-containing protein [Desulfobacterales bacterium HSG16]|nr:CBS domain-containing protein [Desulfobacterales bacterium HSG16]